MRDVIKVILILTLLPAASGCMARENAEGGLLAESAGISESETILTVDGRDVPAWQCLYWLADTCDGIQEIYAGAGTELRWDVSLEDTTLAAYAKDHALQTAALYATVENWSEHYGCVLTEEDQSDIQKDWEAKSEQYGGEEGYLSALADMGLDKERVQLLSEDYYLYQHLLEVFQTEGSPLSPKGTEVEDFARKAEYLTVDFIRVSAEGYPDAEVRRTRAEEVYAKLNASADPVQDFANLAAAYSDDPERMHHPLGCTFRPKDGLLPIEAETASQGLEPNQWSGIIGTSDGDYILLRRTLDTASVGQAYFDQMLQTAAENAVVEVSESYEDLRVPAFYSALEKARTA